MPIASYARRLKYHSPALARNPARRGIKRVALSRFAESRLIIQANRNVCCSERMAHAARHCSVRSHTQMANAFVIFVPQTPFFLTQIFERQTRAEIVSFQRVKHLAGARAAAQAGDGDANGGGIFRRPPPKHHVRKKFFALAAHLPGMTLLRAHYTVANRLAESALNRARRFASLFEAHLPLSEPCDRGFHNTW